MSLVRPAERGTSWVARSAVATAAEHVLGIEQTVQRRKSRMPEVPGSCCKLREVTANWRLARGRLPVEGRQGAEVAAPLAHVNPHVRRLMQQVRGVAHRAQAPRLQRTQHRLVRRLDSRHRGFSPSCSRNLRLKDSAGFSRSQSYLGSHDFEFCGCMAWG